MNASDKDKRLFRYLLCKSIDGEITSEEIQIFNTLLSGSPELEQYYLNNVLLIYLLPEARITSDLNLPLEPLISNTELRELGIFEASAPVLEMPKQELRQELIQKVIYPPQEKRKIGTLSKFTLVSSTAAMLFLVLLVHMVSKSASSLGQIEESMGVVWSDSSSPLFAGDVLGDDEQFLKKGFIRVRMNDGAAAVLEGPAEFRLERENQLFLLQGKLTASVPREAVGFTVRTPSATIVDYGTEFGVTVDKHAITETHVQKGRVEMRLGSDSRVFDQSIRLTSGQAGRITGQTIERIPLEAIRFSYYIPSPFEMRIKEFNPSLYLQVTDYDIDRFKNLARNQLYNIEIGQGVTIVPGPELGMGKTAKALKISGPEKAISIPCYSQALSSLQNPRGFFTTGFWIRFDSITEQIVSSFLVDGMQIEDYYRILFMNKEGKLQHCAYEQDHDLARPVTLSEPLEAHRWYFIMVVRNGEQVDEKSIYVNGKCLASDIKEKVGTGNIGHFQTMQFGGDFNAYKGFSGELAEVIFIPRALSEKEVQSLYQSAIEY
jgi:hypothetical protein